MRRPPYGHLVMAVSAALDVVVVMDPIGSIKPVSYTHLDVYKRQAWEWEPV